MENCKMNITRFSALLVIVILMLTAAVSPVSAQGLPIPQSLEVIITPDGGTFDESAMPLLSQFGLGGFYVDIPAGSVAETITVNISLPTGIPQDIAALQAVEFMVDGAEGPFEFLKPVTIAIPYPASVEDEELLSLGYWDADAGEWIDIDLPGSIVVDTDANMVSGRVTHFSTYGVVAEALEHGGQGGQGGQEGPLTVHPQNAQTVIGDTVQFEAMALDADGNPVEEPELAWSVDNELIGTIDDTGLFTAVAEGEAVVTVTWGDYSDTADVSVSAEEVPLPEGINTITILREFPDGSIKKFGGVNTEGDTINIGGIPHPFNFMNGMRVFFPEGSIEDDIVITLKIPAIGNIDNENKEVTFEGDILTGVTFEVSVEDVVVEPFEFGESLTVWMPYKKGLLENLGITGDDLGMFYWGQQGELIREGIGDVESEETDDGETLIVGKVAHFSIVVLAPDSIPTDVAADAAPMGFEILPAYPNPFNPSTTIPFTLAGQGRVTVGIYNVLGQHVATLVDGVMPAGSFSAVWDSTTDSGERVTSGVYIVHLQTAEHTVSSKLLLMK
jgi:hypothetical protein